MNEQTTKSVVDSNRTARALQPFEVLFDGASGDTVPLTKRLSDLVGPIRLPTGGAIPYVVANFVSTMDGVVALNSGGKTGGSDISGGDAHDRLLMALLRAMAGVIVIGSGTLRGSARHHWAPEEASPDFAAEFRELRSVLGLPVRPTVAVVSASGQVSLDLPLFADRSTPAVIITSTPGAKVLRQSNRGDSVEIVAVGDGPKVGITVHTHHARAGSSGWKAGGDLFDDAVHGGVQLGGTPAQARSLRIRRKHLRHHSALREQMQRQQAQRVQVHELGGQVGKPYRRQRGDDLCRTTDSESSAWAAMVAPAGMSAP